jgi:quercetin dioxygenase-like cupin family protein
MPVVHAADTTVHELHGARFTSYARPSTGAAQLCVWHLQVPVGHTAPPHTVSHEEVLVITSGHAKVMLGDDISTADAGDTVIVPADTLFGMDNIGDEPITALVATSVGLEATLADGTRIAPPWTR